MANVVHCTWPGCTVPTPGGHEFCRPHHVEHSRELLQRIAPEGSVIVVVPRGNPSRSGATHRFDLYTFAVAGDGKPFLAYLTGSAARVMGRRLHKDGGIVVRGGGMDMTYAVVDDLAHAVWGGSIGAGTYVRERL